MDDVIKTLESLGLIPDVFPSADALVPSVLFQIVWPNGQSPAPFTLIPRSDTLDEPDIVITPLNPLSDDAGDASYTMIMLDPDAPSRKDPKYKCFRHWVISGIQLPTPTAVETENLRALKTKPAITPYRAPGPPKGSGIHRYLFILLAEPPSFQAQGVPHDAIEHGGELEQRRSWDGLEFAKQYGLKVVGVSGFLVQGEPEQAEHEGVDRNLAS